MHTSLTASAEALSVATAPTHFEASATATTNEHADAATHALSTRSHSYQSFAFPKTITIFGTFTDGNHMVAQRNFYERNAFDYTLQAGTPLERVDITGDHMAIYLGADQGVIMPELPLSEDDAPIAFQLGKQSAFPINESSVKLFVQHYNQTQQKKGPDFLRPHFYENGAIALRGTIPFNEEGQYQFKMDINDDGKDDTIRVYSPEQRERIGYDYMVIDGGKDLEHRGAKSFETHFQAQDLYLSPQSPNSLSGHILPLSGDVLGPEALKTAPYSELEGVKHIVDACIGDDEDTEPYMRTVTYEKVVTQYNEDGTPERKVSLVRNLYPKFSNGQRPAQ